MKNLSIVIVSALCLVLTACGGDDGSDGGDAGAHILLSQNECRNFTPTSQTYQGVTVYERLGERGVDYTKHVAGTSDIYENQHGESYECQRPVQQTYTTPAPVVHAPAPVVHAPAPTYNAPAAPAYNPAPAPATKKY